MKELGADIKNNFLKIYILIWLIHKTFTSEMFECHYFDDGFIAMEDVYDGEINCMRDGHDETEEARRVSALNLFPEGKI